MWRSWDIIQVWINGAGMEQKSITIPCTKLVCNYIKSWRENHIGRRGFYYVDGNFEKVINRVEFSKILFEFNSCVVVNCKDFGELFEFFVDVFYCVVKSFEIIIFRAVWTNYSVFGSYGKSTFTVVAEKIEFHNSPFWELYQR